MKLNTALKSKLGTRSLFEKREPKSGEGRPWKLLIVDDEPEVHSITRLSLSGFRYDGRPLEFISAHSGAQAKEILAADPEIAILLLDVMMETDDAGLQVVRYVRQDLGNSFLRIILRTGHPGLAPEREMIRAYDINDYRAKTELTQDRMYFLVHTSLSAYQRLTNLARSRRHLSILADEYRNMMSSVIPRLDTPACEIGSLTNKLQVALADHASPEVLSMLQELDQHSSRVHGLAKALQRLAKLTDAPNTPTEFDATAACQEAIDRLQAEIRLCKADITLENLPTVRGYRGHFVDLMEHLLRNAMIYQTGDTPQIHIAARSRGKDWEFAVADRGIGVPPDRTEDVFRTFLQLSDRGGKSATGIGLALCRSIIALHGGRIWVEPRSGGGSLFKFTIPALGALHGDA